jgi:hypothetical protein
MQFNPSIPLLAVVAFSALLFPTRVLAAYNCETDCLDACMEKACIFGACKEYENIFCRAHCEAEKAISCATGDGEACDTWRINSSYWAAKAAVEQLRDEGYISDYSECEGAIENIASYGSVEGWLAEAMGVRALSIGYCGINFVCIGIVEAALHMLRCACDSVDYSQPSPGGGPSPGSGPGPSGYSSGDDRPSGFKWEGHGSHHVLYRGRFDSHIHQMWCRDVWSQENLTVVMEAPLAAGNPASHSWEAHGSQHTLYRGKQDDHIHQIWYRGDVGWLYDDLTALTNAPYAEGSPAAHSWEGHESQHVLFRGRDDDHIHQLWYRGDLGWRHDDLTVVTGAPPAAGNPAAHAWEDHKSQHVLFRGRDDTHIHQLWYHGDLGWAHDDLSAATGAPEAAGSPAAHSWDDHGSQHVLFRGDTDDHIHQLWYHGSLGWRYDDLTNVTGAPTAAGDPSAYVWDFDASQHVVFRGDDNHVHELWYSGADGWNYVDLTIAAQAPSASGDPVGYTWDVDETQHVVYFGDDGHIHELWYDDSWHHNDLTLAATMDCKID